MISVFSVQQLLIKSCKNQRDPQRKSKINTFMNKYNWNGIKYSSKIDYRKTLVINNSTTALNVLYIKEMEICPAYTFINSHCEK